MTADPETLRQIGLASIDNMSKLEKADWLRSRGWKPEGGGKTKKWRSPGGILVSSASVAMRLQILQDEAEA
jgi:hypothetical protein